MPFSGRGRLHQHTARDRIHIGPASLAHVGRHLPYTNRIMRAHTLLTRTALILLLTLAIPSFSQDVLVNAPPAKSKESAPPVPGGTVTGRVVFADTNGPARFAKVLLKAAKPSADANDDLFAALGNASNDSKKPKLSAEDQAQMSEAKAASAKFMAAISDRMLAATIAADGTYLFTNVKAGTYYVHAQAPGYVDPLSQFSDEDFASADPAIRKKIADVAPTITVNGTEQARADLRLERGASISGRVLYDDGTPAAGWTVRTLHDAPAGTPQSLGLGIDLADIDLNHITEVSQTDDTGHFRISGLPAGDYLLEARLTTAALGHSAFNPIASNAGNPFGSANMAGMMGLKLTVYSGNAVRRADATAVKVGTGEDRSGYDITMPLHTMHSIGGVVRAKADAHTVNSGTVDLTAQAADGKPDASIHLTANIQPDGSFHFDYIPGPATYTIKVSHAADVTTTGTTKMFGSTIAQQKTNHSYGSTSLTTVLGDGDILDLKIDVPEVAPPN